MVKMSASAAKREVRTLNRNVTILIIVLIVLLMAGYLLWLRGRFQNVTNEAVITPTPEVIVIATPIITQVIASPSATATAAAKTKTSTPAGSKVK